MSEYFALTVANKINLMDVIKSCDSNSSDFIDAGEILQAMIDCDGGPTDGISEYEHEEELKTNLNPVPLYNPEPGTIEAYLVAIHESGVFDSEPQVKVSGDIDLFGSPYDDWDKSEYEGVAF